MVQALVADQRLKLVATSRRGDRTPLQHCRGTLEQGSALLNARIGSCDSSKGARAPPPPHPQPDGLVSLMVVTTTDE